MDEVTPDEARAALQAVERARLSVVAQIDVPAWYWWSVASGWIVLGVLVDRDNPWLTSSATLVFGAVHASIAARAVSGRHASSRLSVRAEVAGRRLTALVLGALVVLGAVTVAAALALGADGARHPVTAASVLVAAIVVLGGPLLVSWVRRTVWGVPAR